MSVIGFSNKEMGELTEAVISLNNRSGAMGYWWKFVSDQEIQEIQKYNPEKDQQDIAENKIACWMDRLYIGNQLAYIYTYDYDGQEIDRLQSENIGAYTTWSDLKILEKLESLKYNLYSNSGHIFVGPEDLEKLESLLTSLRQKIIRGMKEA